MIPLQSAIQKDWRGRPAVTKMPIFNSIVRSHSTIFSENNKIHLRSQHRINDAAATAIGIKNAITDTAAICPRMFCVLCPDLRPIQIWMRMSVVLLGIEHQITADTIYYFYLYRPNKQIGSK